MLAVLILTVLTMDSFLASVREYCKITHQRVTQWGFALIWDNKYMGLCFMLLFIFAVSVFPEEREKERFFITRIGISKWIWGQSLYLLTFAWIYTVFLIIIQNILLCNVLDFSNEWGAGWSSLANSDVIIFYNVYVTTPYLIISNYDPFMANLVVVGIMGLLLSMLGVLIFYFNFYSKMAGAVAASILVFTSLAASRIYGLTRFSPVSWIRLENHYRITKESYPTVGYIVGMLILLTFLFILLSKMRANSTQENNRRNRRWRVIH
jgi:hypothetical protein